MSSRHIVASVRSRVELRRAGPQLSAPAGPPAAPWLALCPPGASVLRDPTPDRARAGDPGSRVVLVSDRPLGRQHLRRTATLAGLVVERELLVLPGTRQTLVTVDEDPAAVRLFWTAVAVVPPGLTWASLPATAALRVAQRLPSSWTGAVLGGHLLIARRP